jgi:putative drug exporter of the RND superfamily
MARSAPTTGGSADAMTRHLARLADIAYRRRSRMVVTWVVAAIAIIGVGSSLAGEYNADYDTPRSESKAASDLTEERFGGYFGQEIYVVWKDPAGAQRAGAKARLAAFFAEAERVDDVAEHTPIRVSRDGTIGSSTLPLTVPGWEVEKARGEELIAAADKHGLPRRCGPAIPPR